MGQSSGVLFKEVTTFQRCPVMEGSVYSFYFHPLLVFSLE